MIETALIDTAMDTALATVRGASVLNVADAAITLGAALLILDELLRVRKSR